MVHADDILSNNHRTLVPLEDSGGMFPADSSEGLMIERHLPSSTNPDKTLSLRFCFFSVCIIFDLLKPSLMPSALHVSVCVCSCVQLDKGSTFDQSIILVYCF